MTAQVSDSFTFNNELYSIAGVNGDLFIPEDYGMRPVAMCTACWRGYLATYALQDDQLVLKDLGINLVELAEDGRNVTPLTGPEINGTLPLQDPHDMVYNTYEDVNLSLDFTGGILIARDFIQELYVHMGFHDPWKYREVHELIFVGGKLTDRQDVSEELAEIRDKLTEQPLRPDLGEIDLQEWIQSTFCLDYTY